MTESQTAVAETKGRRVTIDLTRAATAEVDRLRRITGLTTADIFRHAFSLFRIYVEAKTKGQELELVGKEKAEPNTRIEIPLTIEELARK